MIALFFEDMALGEDTPLGSFTFTRETMLRFAQRYDPQAFHLDDAAAAASHFGKLSASGWHTAAAWMKCYIATLQSALASLDAATRQRAESRPSPGFTNLRWPRPVYVGDTVAYSVCATAKRDLASRPGWVFLRTSLASSLTRFSDARP